MTLVRNPLGFKTIPQLQPSDQTSGQTFFIVQLKVLRNYTGQCRKWSTIDQQIAQKFGPLSSKKKKKKRIREDRPCVKDKRFGDSELSWAGCQKQETKKIRKSCSC